MNYFEELSSRLSVVRWEELARSYAPTPAEMKAVIQWLKIVSNIAQEHVGTTSGHVLSSPAILLGYVPDDKIAKEIDDQVAKISDAYEKIIIKNAMEWADMCSRESVSNAYPRELFERRTQV